MKDNRDAIRQVHEERAKKQYLEESNKLLELIQDFQTLLKEFSEEDLIKLRSLKNALSSQNSFNETNPQYEEYVLLFKKYHAACEAAVEANHLIKEKYRPGYAINEELMMAIENINRVLALKSSSNEFTEFNKQLERQLEDVAKVKFLYGELDALFKSIESFKAEFYDVFNNLPYIERKVEEFINAISMIKDLLKDINPHFRIGNKNLSLDTNIVVQFVNAAEEKLKSLIDNLSMLTEYCVKNIINPSSDSIWNAQNKVHDYNDQIQGKTPVQANNTSHLNSNSNNSNMNDMPTPPTFIPDLQDETVKQMFSPSELKEMIKQRRVSKTFKEKIDTEIKEYIETLIKQNKYKELMTLREIYPEFVTKMIDHSLEKINPRLALKIYSDLNSEKPHLAASFAELFRNSDTYTSCKNYYYNRLKDFDADKEPPSKSEHILDILAILILTRHDFTDKELVNLTQCYSKLLVKYLAKTNKSFDDFAASNPELAAIELIQIAAHASVSNNKILPTINDYKKKFIDNLFELRGAHINLSGLNISNVNLSCFNLSTCDFYDSTFKEVKLYGAMLPNCNLNLKDVNNVYIDSSTLFLNENAMENSKTFKTALDKIGKEFVSDNSILISDYLYLSFWEIMNKKIDSLDPKSANYLSDLRQLRSIFAVAEAHPVFGPTTTLTKGINAFKGALFKKEYKTKIQQELADKIALFDDDIAAISKINKQPAVNK